MNLPECVAQYSTRHPGNATPTVVPIPYFGSRLSIQDFEAVLARTHACQFDAFLLVLRLPCGRTSKALDGGSACRPLRAGLADPNQWCRVRWQNAYHL